MVGCRRLAAVSAALVASVALTGAGHARQGTSARFGAMRAVAGAPLLLRIEVEDNTGAVQQVRFTVRVRGAESAHTVDAKQQTDGAWWHAELAKEAVPAPPAWLEISAELLGARGGLILHLGTDAPYEVAVITPADAHQEDVLLRTVQDDDDPVPIVGWVGVNARAGSGARARALVGANVQLGLQDEIGVAVSVGPAFERPAPLQGGGPVVLGFELGYRRYAWPAQQTGMAPFAVVFTRADARLPGFDPGVGIRVGAAWPIGAATSFEAAIGGAATVFDGLGDATEVGFSGGARCVIRVGARPTAGETP